MVGEDLCEEMARLIVLRRKLTYQVGPKQIVHHDSEYRF